MDHKTQPYTGSAAAMSTSPWLASEDLIGRAPLDLVIEGVHKNEQVTMAGGKTEALLYSVSFVGASKQLVLNSTNRKMLQRAFGDKTPEWIGKTVTMDVESGIRNPSGGPTVTGLRIKVPGYNGNPLIGKS